MDTTCHLFLDFYNESDMDFIFRCLRWSCLAVLSIPLPCLLCYAPLKGLTSLAESCYQSATSQGCRCSEEGGQGLASPTDSQKRLLS